MRNWCQIIRGWSYLDVPELVDTKGAPVPGDYPENTTTIAPLTPYDKWDGEKWVTDTEAQHSAALDAAEVKRQSLIDAAMASISLIQTDGSHCRLDRKLTGSLKTPASNAVLDYIDSVIRHPFLTSAIYRMALTAGR